MTAHTPILTQPGRGQNQLCGGRGKPAVIIASTSVETYSLVIEHPLLNKHPEALVQATHSSSPGNQSSAPNNHQIGLRYDGGAEKWALFNQDFAPIPTGAAFNIQINAVSETAFVHEAVGQNTMWHMTYIDSSTTNGDPHAIILVTPNWNPNGQLGAINDHSLGVWYDAWAGKWAIFNQDFAPMPLGASFNIQVITTCPSAAIHQATSQNTAQNYTLIENPATNWNPSAKLFVTQNWNPSGIGGTYNNHSLGVRYFAAIGRWAIVNQDFAAMPLGAAFNIEVLQ